MHKSRAEAAVSPGREVKRPTNNVNISSANNLLQINTGLILQESFHTFASVPCWPRGRRQGEARIKGLALSITGSDGGEDRGRISIEM